MIMVTREQIDDFLAKKRIAFVGVSRDSKDFSRQLWQEFRKRNYEMIPVNPNTTEIEGTVCYARLQDVQPPVAAALIITPPDAYERVIQDCAEAGVKQIWMRGVDGKSILSQKALQTCMENGIKFIEGYCPVMFLENAAIFHRFHGFILKLTGKYPKKNEK
jgi:uncharacterized protein